MARQIQGFVALRSDTGLTPARQFQPDAIMLDIRLPEMDGWTVLDRLTDERVTSRPYHLS